MLQFFKISIIFCFLLSNTTLKGQDLTLIQGVISGKTFYVCEADDFNNRTKVTSLKKIEKEKVATVELNYYCIGLTDLKTGTSTLYTLDGPSETRFDYLSPISFFFENNRNAYFSLDMFPIVKASIADDNNLVGLYDIYGNELTPSKYKDVFIFNKTLNAFENEDGTFILSSKDAIVQEDLENIYPEAYGMHKVMKNREYGVINIEGELIIPIDYKTVRLSESMITVSDHNNKYGLYNYDGTLLVPPTFDSELIQALDEENYLGFIGTDANEKYVYNTKTKDLSKYEQVVLPTENQPEELDESDVFTVVDEMPIFQGGGNDAIMNYIAKNTNYPPMAIDNDIQGKVYVRFIVNPKGKVTDVSIAKGADTLLNNEALRVINSFPDFTPGKQDGKAVSVQYILPINFRLN